MAVSLLDFDLGASALELLLDLFRFVLADTLFHGLRSAFDQILGFFEAEVRDLADGLDDLNLVRAAVGENDVELGLLFHRGCSSRSASASTGDGHGRSRHAPLLL